MEIFNTLSLWINEILSFFFGLTNNYGLAIIMLAILVNIVTFPLTRKQIQSSKKLQQVQPELKKIQEKYRNDKEKLNRATMEFMKENKVNPLGGCLPLLVQFPIIIAVFNLLREPENIIMQTIENFSPYFFNLDLMGLKLALDLTQPDPSYILPILAAAGTFFHQRLVMTDPKQRMLMYIFPVMILVISVSFPAGLVLYWLTNSMFSVGNHFIIKTSSEKPVGQKEEKGKKIESEKERSSSQENDAGEKADNGSAVRKETAVEQTPRRSKSKKKTAPSEASVRKKKTSKSKKKGAGKSK